MRFYEAVVKYDRMNDEGAVVKATELYLLEAVSCTDAEAIVTREVEPYVQGSMEVTSVKVSKYVEFIPENEEISLVDGENKRMFGENKNASKIADKYFGVKVSFVTLDEKSGKEKKCPFYYVVHATSVEAATDTLYEFMKGTVSDYEINNVVETKIADIIINEKDDQ